MTKPFSFLFARAVPDSLYPTWWHRMTWFSPPGSCKHRSFLIFSLGGLYFETTVPGLETSHVVFSFSHDLGQSFRNILTGTVLAQNFSLDLELQFHMTWYSPPKTGGLRQCSAETEKRGRSPGERLTALQGLRAHEVKGPPPPPAGR